MDQMTALHTRSGLAPPRADPPDVSLAKLRIRQPRRHRGGPRGSHYNQTGGSPVPAAPLWIEHRPCPLTRIWTTIDNPLIRSPERTPGSVGAPSQVPMCITRYLRAKSQAAAHLMTRIPTLELRKPTSAAAQDQQLVELPTRAAPFLTCSSLRTKFDARPTRMGITRLGPVTSQA